MNEDWLFRPENYEPPKDRDRFLDKSLLGFLRGLSVIRHREERRSFLPVRPSLRIAGALLLLILIALTRSFPYLLILDSVGIAFLVWRTTGEGEEADSSGFPRGAGARAPKLLRKVFRELVLCLAFPLLMLAALIPAILQGNGVHSLLLVLKMASSFLAVRLLIMDGSWSGLVQGFKELRLPDMPIWILDMAYRSIVLLGEHGLSLMQALKLRRVGGAGASRGMYRPLSGILGSLFLNSVRVSEEMAEAMECRGFVGTYRKRPTSQGFGMADGLYAGSLLVLAGLYLLW